MTESGSTNGTTENGAPAGPTGPSPEYRELLNGDISAEEYIEKVKKQVDDTLERERQDERRAAAAG